MTWKKYLVIMVLLAALSLLFLYVSIVLLGFIADGVAHRRWAEVVFFWVVELLMTGTMLLLVIQLYRTIYGGKHDTKITVDTVDTIDSGNNAVHPGHDVTPDSLAYNGGLDIDSEPDPNLDSDSHLENRFDPDTPADTNFAPKRNLT